MKYFGEFLRYVVPHKWRLFLSVLFNFWGTVFTVAYFGMAIPFLRILFEQQTIVKEKVPLGFNSDAIVHNFKYYISQIIIEQGAHKALLAISVIVVIAVFFKSVFFYLANYIFVPLRTGIIKDIRNKLYHKLVYLPMSYLSEERKGDLISRMIGDTQELESSVVSSMRKAIKSPIEFIGYLVTLFIISTHLTLIVLLLLPVSGFLISRLAKNLRKKASKGQRRLGNLLINIEETLFGIRIIKAFAGEEKAKGRFNKDNKNFAFIMNKVLRKKFLAHPISEFLGTLIIVTVMWYGGKLVLNDTDSLQPEVFITFIAIFMQLLSPIKSISNLYFNATKGMAAYERIRVVLQAEESIKNEENAIKLNAFNNSIEYKNVTFSYNPGTPILKNINLQINKGQTVALVGQSGAGKSTLADLLPRFYDIDKGDIVIDGISLKKCNIKSLRNLIGIVSQEQILFNDTIFNNIAFGLTDAKEEDVIKAAKVSNAHEFIINTEDGYNTIIGDRGSKLSGGQRQRVTIARAILVNPPILILDEATSALDVESEKLVQQALDYLMVNRTSIVIAHRLSTVKNADLVCVLKDGEIIEQGNHSELLAQDGVFKDLYQQQMK